MHIYLFLQINSILEEVNAMKTVLWMLFIAILLFGCTSSEVRTTVADIVQNDSNIATQKDIYQFTYSKYWIPFSGKDKAVAMLLGGNPDVEKLYNSADEDALFVTQSFDGEYDCSLLTSDLMGYKELTASTENINGREWCVGRAYEKPEERDFLAVTQCPGKYVLFIFSGSEKRSVANEPEYYKILKSFKCL